MKVVYKIDDDPSVEQRGITLEAGNSLAFPGNVVRLLRSMPDGGRILVQVYARNGPPYENTFPLAGLDPVRRKIAAACNWPQPLITQARFAAQAARLQATPLFSR